MTKVVKIIYKNSRENKSVGRRDQFVALELQKEKVLSHRYGWFRRRVRGFFNAAELSVGDQLLIGEMNENTNKRVETGLWLAELVSLDGSSIFKSNPYSNQSLDNAVTYFVAVANHGPDLGAE